MKEIVSSVNEIISELHLSKIIFIICMIIIFWQLISIKTNLKNVRQGTRSINLIEPGISSKKHTINPLERQVSNLESSVRNLESDFDRIELKVGNLESNVTKLRSDIRQVRTGF